MRYYFKLNEVGSTVKVLLALIMFILVLFPLFGCQKGGPRYFSEISIPFHDNWFFSSISRDNKLIAVVHHESTDSRFVNCNLLVSSTTKVEWLSLFSGDDSLTTCPISAFSPDATMLAVSNQDGKLWIFETTHWSVIQTFHYPWIGNIITWSSNSESILVRGDGEIAIALLTVDGQYQYLLAHSDIYPGKGEIEPYDYLAYMNIVCSPDGKRIAYIAQITSEGKHTASQLWTLDITTNQRTMVYEGGVKGFPSWSPDGTKIALTSNKEIQIYDFQSDKLATVYQAQIIENPFVSPSEYVSTVQWSPDSARIAFKGYYAAGDRGYDEAIYMINLSENKIQVMPADKYEASPGENIDLIQWVKGNDLVVKKYTENDTTVIAIMHFIGK